MSAFFIFGFLCGYGKPAAEPLKRIKPLDHLTRKHTAFRSFNELVTREGYFPTLSRSNHEEMELANAYDAHMASIGDPRRAYRAGKA